MLKNPRKLLAPSAILSAVLDFLMERPPVVVSSAAYVVMEFWFLVTSRSHEAEIEVTELVFSEVRAPSRSRTLKTLSVYTPDDAGG